jgi:hypothetical protein
MYRAKPHHASKFSIFLSTHNSPNKNRQIQQNVLRRSSYQFVDFVDSVCNFRVFYVVYLQGLDKGKPSGTWFPRRSGIYHILDSVLAYCE